MENKWIIGDDIKFLWRVRKQRSNKFIGFLLLCARGVKYLFCRHFFVWLLTLFASGVEQKFMTELLGKKHMDQGKPILCMGFNLCKLSSSS